MAFIPNTLLGTSTVVDAEGVAETILDSGPCPCVFFATILNK